MDWGSVVLIAFSLLLFFGMGYLSGRQDGFRAGKEQGAKETYLPAYRLGRHDGESIHQPRGQVFRAGWRRG